MHQHVKVVQSLKYNMYMTSDMKFIVKANVITIFVKYTYF